MVTLILFAALLQAPDHTQLAKQAYNEGETAYNLGHYEDALRHYEEAYRLSRIPGLLFNLAQSHRRIAEEKGGIEHLKKARELYRAYLREVPISPNVKLVESLLKEVDEKYAAELHKEREHLLAVASGKEALGLAQDFVDQENWPDATFALNKFFRTPKNTRQDLVAGYVLAARVALAQKDEAKAREALSRALVLDPAVAPPPSLGPDIQRAYEGARREVEGKQPLAIKHTARGDVPPGQSPVIRVDIVSDPLHMIHEIVLNYRSGGSKAWSQVESTQGGVLMLPRAVTSGLHPGSRLEYYIEATDEGGGVVQSLGTADGPYAIIIHEEKPWYKNWMVWGAVGAVAIGTTIAIAATHEGPFQSGPQALIDHP